MKKVLKGSLWTVLLLFLAMQLIRPARTNPLTDPAHEFTAIHSTPPEIASMLQKSCNDCHSNRTVWPWYSSVAPASWAVAHDVTDGRDAMNLSEWATYKPEKWQELVGKICEEAKDGEMPLPQYTLLHRGARLSSSDVQTLCSWTKNVAPNSGGETEGDD